MQFEGMEHVSGSADDLCKKISGRDNETHRQAHRFPALILLPRGTMDRDQPQPVLTIDGHNHHLAATVAQPIIRELSVRSRSCVWPDAQAGIIPVLDHEQPAFMQISEWNLALRIGTLVNHGKINSLHNAGWVVCGKPAPPRWELEFVLKSHRT